jgi:CheY-like chemotaxis protein
VLHADKLAATTKEPNSATTILRIGEPPRQSTNETGTDVHCSGSTLPVDVEHLATVSVFNVVGQSAAGSYSSRSSGQHLTAVISVSKGASSPRAGGAHEIRALGFSVCQSRNGKEALQYLAERPEITAMFTDIRMPQMDGNQLVEEAMRMRPDLKIVMTTGFASRINSPHAIPLVRKPYSRDELALAFGLLFGS